MVTGGTGLLGSHIVEQLRRRNRRVRALVRPGADDSWLRTQGVELVGGDLANTSSLLTACRDVRIVYHAAAQVGDWGPWEDFVKVSIEGTRNMVEAAIGARVARFLHISSISAYGHVNGEGLILDESAPLGRCINRWGYYSRAKAAAGHALLDVVDGTPLLLRVTQDPRATRLAPFGHVRGGHPGGSRMVPSRACGCPRTSRAVRRQGLADPAKSQRTVVFQLHRGSHPGHGIHQG